MATSSITPTLKASARSAYRQVWRASSTTFGGDEPVLRAWRAKMRNDASQAKALTDPAEYEKNIQLNRSIAEVLRKNFAPMVRDDQNPGLYKLRLTPEHELGDNESVKDPPPMELPPKGRRRSKDQMQPSITDSCPALRPSSSTPLSAHVDANSVDNSLNETHSLPPYSPELRDIEHDEDGLREDASDDVDNNQVSARRHNYSQLKKVAKKRVMPTLNEDDLEESFVRGSGPGGQSINKTNNNVQLIHKPTGIRVVCQHTRSLELNRMYARRILLERLDRIANPGLSKGEVQRAKQVERERRRRKKAKQREEEDEEEREARRKERKAKRKEEKRLGREKEKEEDDD